MAQAVTTFAAQEITMAAALGDAEAVTFPVGTVAVRIEPNGGDALYSGVGTDAAAMGVDVATVPGGSAEWIIFDRRLHGYPKPVLYMGSTVNSGKVKVQASRVLP